MISLKNPQIPLLVFCVISASLTSASAQNTTSLAPVPPAALPLGANEWTTLYATFDKNLHAGTAKANHYSAGSYVTIAPDGVQGKALSAPNRLSTIVFAGSNLSPEKGTVRIFIKAPASSNIFNDGKEYFLAAAERNSPYRVSTPEIMAKMPGFNWMLYKSTSDDISFGLNNDANPYIRLNGELPAHPMPISIRVPAKDLDPKVWHEITVSWDVPRKKYFLRVNETPVEGVMPAEFQAGVFDYLMLATHPNFYSQRQSPFPGLIDELLVSDRALDEWLSPNAPKQARREEAPAANWPRTEAKLFTEEPLKSIEAQYRTSLDAQARFQNEAGGWNFSFAYPSGMGFMSAKVRTPLPDNRYNNSKDGTSTLAALRFAMAHEVLGEPKYLQVAQRAAESVLAAQHPDGWWTYGWTKTPTGIVRDYADRAPIEDHAQSAPILLLLYLHRLTNDPKYLQGAMKGMDFLISAQNPNGSWSHHYNPAKKHGETVSGKINGGEFNDFTTTGTMKIMLLGYRLTKEPRYLQAYFRGLNFIMAAFIDKGAVGWAQQYDAENKPLTARAFEPVAVENFASAMAAKELMGAYQLTGDTKYLEPARKWVKWLQSKGAEYAFYHDIPSGRPIVMEARQIYFLDDPAQVAAHKAAVEKTGRPYEGTTIRDWVKSKYIAQHLAQVEAAPASTLAERPLPQRAQLELDQKLQMPQLEAWAKDYNWQLTTYRAGGGTPGPRVMAGNPRWTLVGWTLARARALRGDLPLNHPILRMPATFETGDEANIVASQINLYARLSPQEIAAAQTK